MKEIQTQSVRRKTYMTRDIQNPRESGAAVALGLFDGVHLGHRAVIGMAVDAALKEGLRPVAFTFQPTGTLPGSKSGMTLLQSDDQKFRDFCSLGLEEVVEPPFASFMSLSPRQFVEQLLHGVLRARVLVCGENYHFGKAAAGDAMLLRQLAEPLGIRVAIAPPVLWQGGLVSSSRIRQALRQGQLEAVTAMLGSHFAIGGQVLPGKKLGRTLQSPTINQSIPPGFTIPLHGVYLSQVQLPDQHTHWAVTNIGTRPTVQGDGVNCESYLLDFSGDLYGSQVETRLYRLIRPEICFPSTQALAQQIQKDVAKARAMIATL